MKVTSGVFAALLIVGAVATAGWSSLVFVGIAALAAAFAIRGYSVMDGQMLVHHLGWANKFDLAKLSKAEVNPGATIGSVRTMGIGGLLGFVGYFHNQILRSYKAYATNEFNTVVLVFGNETIVVTPDDPEAFVEAVKAASLALSGKDTPSTDD